MSVIAFVGLGAMGGPMATNLVRGGHTVNGFDPSEEACSTAAVNGVRIFDRAEETVWNADLVITMLPSGSSVHKVLLGDAGLIALVKPGTLLIDSSSIDVSTSKAVHASAETAGVHCLDAPVSGGIAGAVAGTLTFMVGGSVEVLEMARPVLDSMGTTIVHVGEGGTGQAAKTCNQMLFGTTLTAVSEMFVLATSLGLDHKALWNIVTNSTGDCRALRHFCPAPDVVPGSAADNDYKPGFSASLMLKDLNLSLMAAAATGQKLPLAESAADAYCDLVAQFDALDCSAIIKVVPTTSR
ncbi:3-hydroxyisobutyrate dehydrogenase [Arthrobacter sp. VKM Ac-2550]|uniref:3-hydroxyisobutyrate dehydrogenase n=1 Tax=Crystallibacter permensis TaxID=1938888 RepID=UPI002226CDA6|nr:3-hydroxyisobutyrate dehydrogenase [Arthrobacter sp. VKM Ac-2550]MCW2131225.1 3-hydroxyisobutyrate dehydrogenase [Arthrobacter sp. VKM Ac-2550]